MAMLGEASDIVTFSIALAIMTRDMSRGESRVAGTAMILTKLISFIATFLDTLMMVWEIVVVSSSNLDSIPEPLALLLWKIG